jgi:2-polyprenyl-3-methyl-5-hydroxy-6-metoxy-1,4-benzoquinol methylase
MQQSPEDTSSNLPNGYEEMLRTEADIWGQDAKDKVKFLQPDWIHYKKNRHYICLRKPVDQMLALIQPGMRVLELGCGSGWLSVAAARQGAEVDAFDLSANAIEVARSYYDQHRDEISGQIQYEVSYINKITLTSDIYDMVLTIGTLHHLINAQHIMNQIYRSLKPGGLFWTIDQIGHQTTRSALLAGALMFILPTHVSYREKIRGLRHFGTRSVDRIKASIEADGLSPFEGIGRDEAWIESVQQQFESPRLTHEPAVAAYIAAQISTPDWFTIPFVVGLQAVEETLLKLRLLHSTQVQLSAWKPEDPTIV